MIDPKILVCPKMIYASSVVCFIRMLEKKGVQKLCGPNAKCQVKKIFLFKNILSPERFNCKVLFGFKLIFGKQNHWPKTVSVKMI